MNMTMHDMNDEYNHDAYEAGIHHKHRPKHRSDSHLLSLVLLNLIDVGALIVIIKCINVF